MDPILIGVREACGLLGIKKTKMFELLRDQQLERKKIGSKTLISLQSIQAFAGNPTTDTEGGA